MRPEAPARTVDCNGLSQNERLKVQAVPSVPNLMEGFDVEHVGNEAVQIVVEIVRKESFGLVVVVIPDALEIVAAVQSGDRRDSCRATFLAFAAFPPGRS